MKTLKTLLLASSFVASSAHAVNIQHFSFANNTKYTMTEDAFANDDLVNEYKWIFSFDTHYQNDPLVTTDRERTEQKNIVVSGFKTLDIGLAHKIGNRFELGVNTFAAQVSGPTIGESRNSLGDTTLKLKAMVTAPHSRTKFALIPKLVLPTGKKQNFIGDGKGGYGLTGALERKFAFFTVAGNLGYVHKPEGSYKTLDYRNMLLASLGVSVPLPGKNTISVDTFHSRSANRSSPGNNPGEVIGALRHQYSKDLGLWGGIGLGNIGAVSSNDFRGFVGLRYTPQPKKHQKLQPVRIGETRKYGDLIANESVFFGHDKSDLTYPPNPLS